MTKVTLNGHGVHYAACVELMDDELREHLHDTTFDSSEQAFLEAYCALHFLKFGEEFHL